MKNLHLDLRVSTIRLLFVAIGFLCSGSNAGYPRPEFLEHGGGFPPGGGFYGPEFPPSGPPPPPGPPFPPSFGPQIDHYPGPQIPFAHPPSQYQYHLESLPQLSSSSPHRPSSHYGQLTDSSPLQLSPQPQSQYGQPLQQPPVQQVPIQYGQPPTFSQLPAQTEYQAPQPLNFNQYANEVAQPQGVPSQYGEPQQELYGYSQSVQIPPGRYQPLAQSPQPDAGYGQPLQSNYGPPQPSVSSHASSVSSSPTSSYHGYFYQVNQGYNPREVHNSLVQSPQLINIDGSKTPISYEEQIQLQEQVQYSASQTPSQGTYGSVRKQPQDSVPPTPISYSLPLDLQSSYQTYRSPSPSYGSDYSSQNGGSQDNNNYGATAFGLSAPSNDNSVVQKAPLGSKATVIKAIDLTLDDDKEKSLVDVRTNKGKLQLIPRRNRINANLRNGTTTTTTSRSTTVSSTTTPTTPKAIVTRPTSRATTTQRPRTYGINIPYSGPTSTVAPTSSSGSSPNADKAVKYGQRLYRGRARNPFRKPELEPTTPPSSS